MKSILIIAILIINISLISGCLGDKEKEKVAPNSISENTIPTKTATQEINNTPEPQDSQKIEPTKDKAQKIEPTNANPHKIKPQENISQEQKNLKREPRKKIGVHVNRTLEQRDAKLIYSDDKSYSLYVLNNYTYTPEEPGKDVIFSNFDGEFFVRIEKLDINVNIEQLKQSQKSVYETMGKVSLLEPSTIFEVKFKDSLLWLNVDIPKSLGMKTKGNINYIVKKFGNQLFAFTFFMPLKESAEAITPSLWAMLATLEVE